MVRNVACLSVLAAGVIACGSDSNSDSGGSASGATAAPAGSEAAASTSAAAPAEEPYTVTVAQDVDVTSLDPQKIQEVPGRVVYGNIFEPLVRRSADGKEIQPLLAAELPTSIDPTTWEVKLRDDVTFASGKKFTADDVVYTFNRLFDPALDSEQADLLQTIAKTEAVDPLTVRFTTKEPDPILPNRLTYALIMPEGQGEVAGFPEQGLDGSGAYELVSHTPEVEVKLKKRDDYWGDSAGAPTDMVYKVIPDPATRLAALQANEIDVAFSLSPEQAKEVPQAKPVLTTESGLLRTNALKGPFTDERLRKAASMAIDRQTIVDTLFLGQADVSACQIAAPTVFGHTDGLTNPDFDPEAAKALVQEAYKGETITMYGAGRFAKMQEVAQVIAQELQDVGFKVDLQFPTNQDELIAQFQGDKSKYIDLMLFQSSAELFDEAQQLQWITSDGIYSTMNNPEADALAKTATTETDPAKRQAAYDDLNKVICDQVMNIYLYYPPDIYGLSDKIDWQPRSDGLVILTDIRQKK